MAHVVAEERHLLLHLLKDLALNEHDARATCCDLKWLVLRHRDMRRVFLEVHDKATRELAKVLLPCQGCLTHAIPVDLFLGTDTHDNVLVGQNHVENVDGSELHVCVDKKQVRVIGLQELVSKVIACPCYQALIEHEGACQTYVLRREHP